MKHFVDHIHFVGLGGSGMSGIAEVLCKQGYTVSGSDQSDSSTLHHLAELGIRTFVGHQMGHVEDADVVVISSAVRRDNPEVQRAQALGIPVVSRAQMLAELMRTQKGIAVAGTHGKTTTTSLLASVLLEAGMDPSFVIGGLLRSAGTNAHQGQGDFIVVEADESDASFLELPPIMAVVTNIDADHMETYGHDVASLQHAFVDFLHRLPFYGVAVVCGDDSGVRNILDRLHCRVIRYGFDASADVRAVDVRAVGSQMHFTVQRKAPVAAPDLAVVLNLVGRHNVLNALAVIAVAGTLQVPDAKLGKALAEFCGVGRRFERYGDLPLPQGGVVTVIDDYGHHPAEIAATLEAARGAYPGRRLVLAFQPHRYTRTRDCFGSFVEVLAQADAVLLAEVYAAGEAVIAGADSRSLAQALRNTGKLNPIYAEPIGAMPQAILDKVQDGDVLLCMGAGSIGEVAAWVRELLQKSALFSQEGQLL